MIGRMNDYVELSYMDDQMKNLAVFFRIRRKRLSHLLPKKILFWFADAKHSTNKKYVHEQNNSEKDKGKLSNFCKPPGEWSLIDSNGYFQRIF